MHVFHIPEWADTVGLKFIYSAWTVLCCKPPYIKDPVFLRTGKERKVNNRKTTQREKNSCHLSSIMSATWEKWTLTQRYQLLFISKSFFTGFWKKRYFLSLLYNEGLQKSTHLTPLCVLCKLPSVTWIFHSTDSKEWSWAIMTLYVVAFGGHFILTENLFLI